MGVCRLAGHRHETQPVTPLVTLSYHFYSLRCVSCSNLHMTHIEPTTNPESGEVIFRSCISCYDRAGRQSNWTGREEGTKKHLCQRLNHTISGWSLKMLCVLFARTAVIGADFLVVAKMLEAKKPRFTFTNVCANIKCQNIYLSESPFKV